LKRFGTVALLASLLGVASSCASSDSDGLLLINVRGRADGLRQFSAVLTVAGRTSKPVRVPEVAAEGDLAMPLTFALRAPAGVDGTGDLVVEAFDEGGGLIQRIALQATVVAGQATPVDLCLGSPADCPALPDAGVPDGGVVGPDGGSPGDGGVQTDAAPPDQCVGDGDCTALTDNCSMGQCNAQKKCVKVPANQGQNCARPCQDVTTCSYSGLCASTGTKQRECVQHTCQAGVCTAGQTVVETTSDGCTRSRTGVKCTTYGWCLQITNTVQCECMGGECVNPCGMYECRNL